MSKSTPSAIPGVSMMTDTLDFFKNMWENVPGMNLPGMKHIPGMVMPTLSVDEIDKQIKDLKAVESWLTLNMNMLQGTIQALEVQKATISTLQTMGETFSAAIQTPPMPATSDMPGFQSPFSAPSAAATAAAEKSAAEKAATEKAAAEQAAAREKSAAREKRVAEATASAAKSPVQPALDATAAMADAMQPLANPAAWWGMLQDQFKQAVDTAAAMTPDAAATHTESAPKAAKSSAKSTLSEKAEAKTASRKRKQSSK